MVDRTFYPEGEKPPNIQNATTIPCQHIGMGDILILQGRPCQVIRISISSVTGQHRYLGVDPFTKQLHEGFSFIVNPTPDIAVHSMHYPVLKQYRVLDIQENSIVAMTETGDVKNGVPVIDQSNLWNRLQVAFNGGRGISSVLVLIDGDKELVIDMKIFNPSTLGGPSTIHEAVMTGNKLALQAILSKHENINELDTEGTELFAAVESGRRDIVELLIQYGADINAIDKQGRTVLDIAIFVLEDPSMASKLLSHRASPTAGIAGDVLGLLQASAEGYQGIVESLLKDGVDVNGHDRLGYTALHEAAIFGHHDIASQLIRHGADINARVALGKDTVLHTVVCGDRSHRVFLGLGSRGRNPVLGSGHVEIVKTLLQNGATASQKRHDGRTMEDLLKAKLLDLGLSEPEQRVLQQIQEILKNHPKVQAKEIRGESNTKVAKFDNEKARVCDLFNARIQYHTSGFYLPREVSIRKFIYHQWEHATDQDESIQPITLAKEMEGKQYWRWIHLPANNKIWVKDTIRNLYESSEISLTLDNFKEVIRFIDSSYNEYKGSISDIRLRRPSFKRCPKSDHLFSMVVPYFDVEALENYISRRENEQSPFRKRQDLERVYRKFGDEPEDLHIPYSLDQFYYSFLNDSTDRDKTQVVVKYAELRKKRTKSKSPYKLATYQPEETEESETSSNKSKAPQNPKKLLMVNQMWLWKISSDTFITAFPDRSYSSSEVELLTQISQGMAEDLPATIDSTIMKVLDSVVGFVDAPSNAGLDENVFDIFEQSIAYEAQAETECFREFTKWQKISWIRDSDASQAEANDTSFARKVKMQEESAEYQEKEKKLCDITKEVEHLSEIKDIRDELRMIERVLVDQKVLINQYRSMLKEEDAEDHLYPTSQDLDGRVSKVERLEKDALWVENSIKSLLDLKQKQGNLNDAIDTHWLANDGHKRQKAGERQNQLLFVFTMITVVFTPMSFVTSFLAIPSRDFPQNDAGDSIGWRWWQVLISILVLEAVTSFWILGYWFDKKWYKSVYERVLWDIERTRIRISGPDLTIADPFLR
ncbi:uncharacterized protein F4812DRAFT_412023 [Daldinia caldariorum]|uniref:uncharacterized protein n=1 Tax=Daldinia caldariorum TaxID=326644 RepID=UPI002008511F|nr:uncharacterized protein F4812DRAFT_412023 [Daldinia caldariorum]KAI1473225.1 hypothetical protein F4812DRAFT_412023 [Daldinia caldariorum]